MKTIFITGASSGIGAATAQLFAKKGWNVIATMRDPLKGKELSDIKGITVMPLDVTDYEQSKLTINNAIRQFDVDVLFNNAGYGLKAPLEAVNETQIRKIFDTDLFGSIQVTQEFIPYFKSKKNGLILTTTSLAGIIAFPQDSIYGAAKRALTSICEALYYELKPYNVAVKALLPGATRTSFKMERFPDDAYKTASERLTKILIPDFETQFPTAEDAAEVVWEAVSDNKDQLHYLVGDAAKSLYLKYHEMGVEEFKKYFYETLFL